jgi:hypothetical protein
MAVKKKIPIRRQTGRSLMLPSLVRLKAIRPKKMPGPMVFLGVGESIF